MYQLFCGEYEILFGGALDSEAETEGEGEIERTLLIDTLQRGIVPKTVGGARLKINAQPRQADKPYRPRLSTQKIGCVSYE